MNIEKQLKKYTEGDAAAFNSIYDQTFKAVYYCAYSIVRNREQAEDIAQETYLKALSNLHLFRRETNFTGWLVTICKNLAINGYRKNKREVFTDFAEEEYRFPITDAPIPFIFELAKRCLPEDEYEIVILCQVAGYKRREVAEMLTMPIATVTWKNNVALKKLREELQKEEKSL